MASLVRPHFTTRKEYETALVHLFNGICQSRLRSSQRERAEKAFNAVSAEMIARFPIPLYTVEWFEGGRWRVVSSMQMDVDFNVAELRRDQTIARMKSRGSEIWEHRIVQTGAR